MELRLGGYFPKVVVSTPDWIHAERVVEVCSVSTCVSRGPDGWIDHWLHNALGWFDSPEAAARVIPLGGSATRLFAYKVGTARYRRGTEEGWAWPLVNPVPLQAFRSLGFDAVSKSMESGLGFECSPLSCCDLAAEVQANRFCLMETLEGAVAAAARFSLEEPEPGPYYIVEVMERA